MQPIEFINKQPGCFQEGPEGRCSKADCKNFNRCLSATKPVRQQPPGLASDTADGKEGLATAMRGLRH